MTLKPLKERGIPASQLMARLRGRLAAIADAEVNRQALMIAYINDYWMMMWAAILMLPVVLLLRPARARPSPETMVID